MLPEGMIVPTAFETVGHIAHLNLREEHLPYKKLIAKVVLDKNKPKIRTVANKIDSIDNEYRTMQLEVLAGNHSLVTTLTENGLRFHVDLAKVTLLVPYKCTAAMACHRKHATPYKVYNRYWNSRLGTERQRLLSGFTRNDVVFASNTGVQGVLATTDSTKPIFHHMKDIMTLLQEIEKNFRENARTAIIWAVFKDMLPVKYFNMKEWNLSAREYVSGGVRCQVLGAVQEIKKQVGMQEICDFPTLVNKSDVFSGVGPLAISAAKIVKRVFANDLNPYAVEYLERNSVLNKLERKIKVFNMDGRRFIKAMFASDKAHSITQVVMNLPNDAAEFLDAFRGIYKDRPKDGEFTFPMIHVYGFSKAEDPEFNFHERIRIALLEVAVNVDMRRVRLVAPGKWMLCASFILPKSVAFANTAVDA
ncbi:tRNA (guanine(37)-N1)-methyltransferase 1-like protein [Trifolium pratense]|uniref:tRNA (Guanine(37)-N1)-methyltransferase 1-like protein n=1 Tax=Trifolium pratense TaxID=57577 RepID=A0A2K3P8I8_TRIPR|nr:tRNA (guanine(37)-N1)-methyltransferase 1-like protein [Trifolium pratense]